MYKYNLDYNRNIYDGIKEFCLCEKRVNEEYMRNLCLEEKNKSFSKLMITLKMMLIALIK